MSSESFPQSYPCDVSDEEWAFAAPYLALVREDAPPREHSLREVFHGLRYLVKTGAPGRYLPVHFPPWWAVYQQTQRWISAHVFENMAEDLRVLLRLAAGRPPGEPTAVVIDSRTLQSTPESGHRAGWDGAKKRQGSKLHLAVDTLGHLLALHVTAADQQDRAPVGVLCHQAQQATGETVQLADVDQGYTGPEPAAAAETYGIRLEVVKLPEAKRGFVLLPRRWVVERTFGWASRFRRLARDYERLPETVAGLHLVAFVTLFLRRAVTLLIPSP
jgi:transposase